MVVHKMRWTHKTKGGNIIYNQLNTQEKALVESQVANNQKNLVVAYILLIFLGEFGLHRYYLSGKYEGPALAQLILGIAGWMTVWFLIGFIPLMIVYTWNCVDLFLLPGIAKNQSDKLKESYAERLVLERNAQAE